MFKSIVFSGLAATFAAGMAGPALAAAPSPVVTACQAQWRDMVGAHATKGMSARSFMKRCLARQDDPPAAHTGMTTSTGLVAATGAAGVIGVAVAASQGSNSASP